MIKQIVQDWEDNKKKLEDFFRNNAQEKYDSYEKILYNIFDLCLNKDDKYDIDNMVIIDHGEYQGTQLFIIPKKTYQPTEKDYLITNNYYGSCSGCDTLLGISYYDCGVTGENQIKEYMALSLHLVQRLKYIYE